MFRTVTFFFALSLGACSSGSEDPLFGGGGINETTPWEGTTDTGMTGTTDVDTSVAPEITNLEAGFEEFPNMGEVAKVTITYTDPQDDVSGGMVWAEFTDSSDEAAEITADIDDTSAWLDEGAVIFAVQDLPTGVYVLRVRLYDVEGNGSYIESTTFQ